MRNAIPVSYTHLDVYKRQFLDGVRGQHRPAGGAAGHHVGVIAKDRKGMGSQRAGRHMPVSYTHLDVYKRQLRGHEDARGPLDRDGHRTIQPPHGQQAHLIPAENLALSCKEGLQKERKSG